MAGEPTREVEQRGRATMDKDDRAWREACILHVAGTGRAYGRCDLCGARITADNVSGWDEDGHLYCTGHGPLAQRPIIMAAEPTREEVEALAEDHQEAADGWAHFTEAGHARAAAMLRALAARVEALTRERDALADAIRALLASPDIADLDPEDKDPETSAAERMARLALRAAPGATDGRADAPGPGEAR